MKNRMSDIEFLSAYLDGQLSGDETDLLEWKLSKDPGLRALLDKLQMAECQLKATISDIEFSPMSDRLQGVLRQEPFSKPRDIPLLERWAAIKDRVRQLAVDQMLPATAAVLVIVGAVYVSKFTSEGQSIPPESTLVSAEALQNLHNTVAGETASTADGLLVEVLAFRRGDEVLCKQYSLQGERSLMGIACFELGTWTNVAIVQRNRPSETAGYQPASGDQVPKIDAYIEKNMINGVLTIEEEKAAMSDIQNKQ